MSRGTSYGGGKSSLSYLFEQDETSMNVTTAKQARKVQAKEHEISDEANRTSVFMSKPAGEKAQTKANSKTKIVPESKPQKHVSSDGIGRKYQDRSAVHFHTGRSSTKVNSVPGGQSSLGYLFGDSDESMQL